MNKERHSREMKFKSYFEVILKRKKFIIAFPIIVTLTVSSFLFISYRSRLSKREYKVTILNGNVDGPVFEADQLERILYSTDFLNSAIEESSFDIKMQDLRNSVSFYQNQKGDYIYLTFTFDKDHRKGGERVVNVIAKKIVNKGNEKYALLSERLNIIEETLQDLREIINKIKERKLGTASNTTKEPLVAPPGIPSGDYFKHFFSLMDQRYTLQYKIESAHKTKIFSPIEVVDYSEVEKIRLLLRIAIVFICSFILGIFMIIFIENKSLFRSV